MMCIFALNALKFMFRRSHFCISDPRDSIAHALEKQFVFYGIPLNICSRLITVAKLIKLRDLLVFSSQFEFGYETIFANWPFSEIIRKAHVNWVYRSIIQNVVFNIHPETLLRSCACGLNLGPPPPFLFSECSHRANRIRAYWQEKCCASAPNVLIDR